MSGKIPTNKTLLERIIKYYQEYKDDIPELLERGKRAKRQGYFSKQDFVEICMMKSARPKKHYQSNHPATIRKATSEALRTKYEKRKISKLCELKGVNIPVASTLLTAIDPKFYGIIDIRVWQALFWLGILNKKPSGVNFNEKDWYTYLTRLRYWAEKLDISVRRLEVTLFHFHKDFLQGDKKLYDPNRCISKQLTKKQQEQLRWLVG